MGIGELKALGLNYWQNPKVKQVMMLFSVNIAGIPLGIVTSIILTRYLGPTDYGNYQFLDGLLNFAALMGTFGLFQAANRALVLNQDKEKSRQYYGASLVILFSLFLLLSVALVIYSIFDHNLREKHLNHLLLISIPFVWVYLSTRYFEVLFQADNRMNLLAISRFMTKVCFLAAAVIIYFVFFHVKAHKLHIAWVLYLCAQVVICLYVFFRIKLSFKNLKANVREIWNYNKSYGFHVYVGGAFSVGVSALTSVIISYFGTNNAGVGFYILALTLASPLQFIPNTIATTNYKEFSEHKKIPLKLTKITFLLTIISLVALWVIVPFFIRFFYGQKFEPVIFLNFLASIGVAFYGLADYYNRFLGAHGYGKVLRNSSFIVGTLILIFNFILVPWLGAEGAALTKMLSGLTYFICMLYYYKKTSNKH